MSAQATVDAVVRETASPANEAALVAFVRSPEMQDALGDASRQIARNAVLGSNAALNELAREPRAGAPLGSISAFFAGRSWLIVLAIAAVLATVLVVWLVRSRASARRYRETNERRLAEASALIRAIEASGERPSSGELLALLKKEFARDASVEARPHS